MAARIKVIKEVLVVDLEVERDHLVEELGEEFGKCYLNYI